MPTKFVYQKRFQVFATTWGDLQQVICTWERGTVSKCSDKGKYISFCGILMTNYNFLLPLNFQIHRIQQKANTTNTPVINCLELGFSKTKNLITRRRLGHQSHYFTPNSLSFSKPIKHRQQLSSIRPTLSRN